MARKLRTLLGEGEIDSVYSLRAAIQILRAIVDRIGFRKS